MAASFSRTSKHSEYGSSLWFWCVSCGCPLSQPHVLVDMDRSTRAPIDLLRTHRLLGLSQNASSLTLVFRANVCLQNVFARWLFVPALPFLWSTRYPIDRRCRRDGFFFFFFFFLLVFATAHRVQRHNLVADCSAKLDRAMHIMLAIQHFGDSGPRARLQPSQHRGQTQEWQTVNVEVLEYARLDTKMVIKSKTQM
eukprot:SAG31_NODE_3683_length_3989_cov_3.622108_2_plen_196_part_00